MVLIWCGLADVSGFSANILAESQQAVSQACAAEPLMAQRFAVGNWREHADYQLPYLEDALTVFFCRVSQRIDYGTHMIVIGDIQSVQVADTRQAPLVYCRGDYRKLW